MDEVKGDEPAACRHRGARPQLPDATLTFVGTGGPDDLARWTAMAASSASSARCASPGSSPTSVPGHELGQGRPARPAAHDDQRRGVGGGRPTACRGVPTVVTDLGWTAELPTGRSSRWTVEPRRAGLAERSRALLERAAQRFDRRRGHRPCARHQLPTRGCPRYLDAARTGDPPRRLPERPGAQNPVFWDRGIARYVVEHPAALLEVAPERVHSRAGEPGSGFTPSCSRCCRPARCAASTTSRSTRRAARRRSPT